MFDVFCYGAVSLDISGRLERPVLEHGQATAVDYRISAGGDATLVALTLAGLGLNVGLGGSPVGDDPMGEYLTGRLEEEGVTACLPKKGKTAMAAIALDDDRRSTITFHDNTPEDEIAIPGEITDSRYIYVDGCFGRNSVTIAQRARVIGIRSFLNLDVPSLPNIGLYEVVVANENVAKLLAPDPVEAARKIYEANDSLAIVTLGELGCIGCDGGIVSVPAFDVNGVDTTGCGAAFAAGFIYAELRGLPLDECLEFASAAGALKAMARGSYRRMSEQEVARLISTHKNR